MENERLETAIFAGGCFWGMEHMMRKFPGVKSVMPGYIGGHKDHPRYEEVKAHTTGHAEAVRVQFDPSEVSFEELARYFFEIHDPTQTDGQGPDLGPQYRSEIFYTSEEQKQVSEKLIVKLSTIAEITSTNLSTTKSRLYKALKLLKLDLGGMEDDRSLSV